MTLEPAAKVRPSPSIAPPDKDSLVLGLPLDTIRLQQFDDSRFATRAAISVLFDGVLHDASHLASEFGVNDTAGAACTIAAAYERAGLAMLPRLRGCFLVVIIDRARSQTVVARDPLGAHPVYYAVADGRVWIAADPAALLARPGVSRELNRIALAERLCSRWPEATETYFAAVRRIPPGSRALIRSGQIDIHRYWDPLPEDQPVQWISSLESFDSVLDRAVERCLQIGSPGVFLSGGLDSISIAALATDLSAKAGRSTPRALSLGFPDPGCDERFVQTSVARQLGMPHDLVGFWDAVGPEGLLDQTVRLNAGLAAPVLNIWAPAYLALARAGDRAGVRTVLTGSGGDEWLTVTPYLAADLIARGRFVSLANFAMAWRRSYGQSWRHLSQNLLWQYGLRPLASMALHRLAPEAWAARRIRRVTRLDPDWVAPDPSVRRAQQRRAPRHLSAADPRHGFYLADVRTGLDHSIVSLEMEEQYQFGQRLGLRFMHPYWDADLVDMLYRVSPQLLHQAGHSKAPVRATLARRFPTLGFERQRKVVATAFLRKLLAKEGPIVQETIGDFDTLASLGVIDAAKARTFARQAFRQAGSDMYRAWELLNLESWARAHSAHAIDH